MNILLVTPAQRERFAVPDAAQRFVAFAAALRQRPALSVEVLDIGALSLERDGVEAMIHAIGKERSRIETADLIHAWSAVPLLLRPLFPRLLLVTLPDGGPLGSFLPQEGEPGVAMVSVAACDDPERLEQRYRALFENNRRRDARPWGYWEALRLTDTHKVKHIFVAPGEKLSLQYHKRRREVWTVVAGSGIITVGDEPHEALPGRVFIIEKGQKHRAEGGPSGLHFIEVQTGDYLGEDDIVRIEDRYGRAG